MTRVETIKEVDSLAIAETLLDRYAVLPMRPFLPSCLRDLPNTADGAKYAPLGQGRKRYFRKGEGSMLQIEQVIEGGLVSLRFGYYADSEKFRGSAFLIMQSDYGNPDIFRELCQIDPPGYKLLEYDGSQIPKRGMPSQVHRSGFTDLAIRSTPKKNMRTKNITVTAVQRSGHTEVETRISGFLGPRKREIFTSEN